MTLFTKRVSQSKSHIPLPESAKRARSPLGARDVNARTYADPRAFDARTGSVLWSDKLPAPAHTTPTTYMGRDGKQYVVIGANGGGYFGSPTSDEVIAYTLK